MRATRSIYHPRRYVSTTSKIITIKRPSYTTNKISKTRTNAFENDIVSWSYIVGKGIITFTFFYTSLNYLHYKRLREENEEDTKSK